MILDNEIEIDNCKHLHSLLDYISSLTDEHRFEKIYQVGIEKENCDDFVEAIYFNCKNKKLYQLVFQDLKPPKGVWKPIELEKHNLNIIYRKDLEYQLLSWQSKLYIIDCFCGSTDIFDVNYILNEEEVNEYFTMGVDFLDNKSSVIKCRNNNAKTG